jgi:hypothetical protein
MWMEEKIGKSINVERTDEALGLDPDLISTACPFCMVMLSDAVTAKQQSGDAKDGVQVLDVSQILARSLVAPQPALVGVGAGEVGSSLMTGAADVTPDVTVEAPKPVGATPAETAQIDQAMLAQVDPSSAPPVTTDPASSGATLRTPSVTAQPASPPPADQAPARTREGHGPTPGSRPAHSTGSPGDAPGGATEGQGPGNPRRPDPQP